jgi:hypothetical protein
MSLLPENRVIAWGTAIGVLLTCIGMIVAGVVYEVRLRDDANASRVSDVDHESRLRSIEGNLGDMRGDVREIKTNVGWIRRYIDKQPAGPDDLDKAAKTARNEP